MGQKLSLRRSPLFDASDFATDMIVAISGISTSGLRRRATDATITLSKCEPIRGDDQLGLSRLRH
jgi:hypothetical protein